MNEIELLEFIQSEQLASGGFASVTHSAHTSHTTKTIFFPALIGIILSEIDHPIARDVTKNIVRFLLKEKSENWTWNYWDTSSKEHTTLPYPDDLDDTFCALAAIYAISPELITGEALADTISVLTQVEVQEGGPYNTWIVDDVFGKWHDVDIAVNSNVAYFLSLLDITLPHLDEMFEGACKKSEWISSYYSSSYPVVYLLSRHYASPKLLSFISSNQPANDLEKALAYLTKKNLGEKRDTIYFEQATTQFPFCKDPVRNKTHYFAGCSALTAALCAAALHQKPDPKRSAKRIPIIQSSFFPKPMVKEAQKAIDTYLDTQSGYACVAVVQDMFEALGKPRSVTQGDLQTIASAQALGWLAYSLFDEVIDEGHTSILPLAQYTAREMLSRFFSIHDERFRKECNNILTIMDGAQHIEAQESSGNTYADMRILAEKSYGYMLGPLAVMCLADQHRNISYTRRYFHHFLIAKQLGDDMHDWQEDMQKNRPNPVTEYLAQKTNGNTQKYEIFFWEKGVVHFLMLIEEHCDQAQKNLSRANLENPSHLEKYIQGLREMCAKTYKDLKQAEDFMSKYHA